MKLQKYKCAVKLTLTEAMEAQVVAIDIRSALDKLLATLSDISVQTGKFDVNRVLEIIIKHDGQHELPSIITPDQFARKGPPIPVPGN